VTTAPTYYPEYEPTDPDKFAAMELLLGTATDVAMLRQLVLLYTFDMSYDRGDILVALGRVEHARGWKVDP
jgi:hypothetical protein